MLSAKTGEPLDGVSVSCEIRGEGEPRKETVTTGKEGTASIEWPPGITIRFLGLNVKKPGYVGLFFYWDDRNHAISLPESQEARLELGVPISGVVQDEAGKPIAQASVTAMATATEGEAPHYGYELGTTKTDEQGRWQHRRCPGKRLGREPARPPSGLPTASRRNRAAGESGGRSSRKRATVKGRVVDGSGKPVKGAQVDTGGMELSGQRTPVATDELGEYTLRGCERGFGDRHGAGRGFRPRVSGG